ncbi:unnamed protein product [Schistocephalus solidus]|uniref:Uncharacterized protein n=1 Tax=Schistocephalus solidus TaxID=70667 RepID=A0A3P7D6A3_SCHSO|nr:unnamed protein product [Schistocephalus solidus]
MWLFEVGFIPAATPRATVTTGGLNQVRVSGVVCASTPVEFGSRLGCQSTLFRDSTACLLSEDRARKCALNKRWLSRFLQPARVSPLTLAAWNIRSILENPRSNRPERRTARVTREMARHKVDIAAFSETRFSEQGQLEEVGAGENFFWSGWPKSE